MKTQLEPLFAIFRDKNHLGNVRAKNVKDAIELYIKDSVIDLSYVKESKFIERYTAKKANKGIHYL